ncbi:GAF and ANTAR domain-containing protein [Mycobacterium sp. ITM-2016-00317]|uniref:GAF and ANTAR domain-containing protein n=1 Tax=Mycobacterium sp. ITM-2016-00317 TaxID=2099694 RepID=UPI00287FF050|nr:GAF and ANTAR domain-containing protein [Mycobacterium sp. ITM-2016-00317]WNG88060.1 GAF and ANTAR domain-containing protein [Mycobacterium sp. ITM-2016-00317]
MISTGGTARQPVKVSQRLPNDDRPTATGLRKTVGLIRSIQDGAGSDPNHVIEAITSAAVVHIPGVDHAGVTLVLGNTLRPVGCTDGLPLIVNKLQERHGEGPCFDAVNSQEPLCVPDLEAAERWPCFAKDVLRETPIRSVMALRLFKDEDGMGVLSFHADRPGAWSDESDGIAIAFAAQAALLVENKRREKYFRTALAHRDVIGQAKGMLMERMMVDAATAFAFLVRVSRERGEPVAAVARRIVRNEAVVIL